MMDNQRTGGGAPHAPHTLRYIRLLSGPVLAAVVSLALVFIRREW